LAYTIVEEDDETVLLSITLIPVAEKAKGLLTLPTELLFYNPYNSRTFCKKGLKNSGL